MNAPEEHMGPNVAVVTTSTFFTSEAGLSFSPSFLNSSAVSTTAFPDFIFWLISSIDFDILTQLFGLTCGLKQKQPDQGMISPSGYRMHHKASIRVVFSTAEFLFSEKIELLSMLFRSNYYSVYFRQVLAPFSASHRTVARGSQSLVSPLVLNHSNKPVTACLTMQN